MTTARFLYDPDGRLLNLRVDLDWKQEELAAAAGVSWPVISRAENGKPIRLLMAQRIARALSERAGRPIHRDDLFRPYEAEEVSA